MKAGIAVLGCVLAVSGTVSAYQDYNATLGKQILYYATATYCDSSTVQTWTCGSACQALPGVSDVTLISDWLDGTFGFVAYNGQTNDIVVAFRGSRNVANWYSDFDYFMKPYPNGPQGAEVHGGFYADYEDLSS